jgi:hypothetical protein
LLVQLMLGAAAGTLAGDDAGDPLRVPYRPAAVRFSGPPSLAIDTHSTERRIISSDSTRKLSRQLRRDSGVVEEERQVRSHAFTAGEYAQAVE